MSTSLCIHGHFYQPPRFDPWLEAVLPEGSAAPAHDWNERICRECYTPVAWARILDDRGRIREMLNCYAWMSFNFGPTLLRWMELQAPETYARILEGDRLSLERVGHGNALAQVYHHAIMPLATEMDKDLETGWAVQDFQARFGRDPEGMWLAETAVDLPTLESLVKHNIRFTILAPRQARAVRSLTGGEFRDVNEDSVDTTRPYLVRLPSGRSITVFFYDGQTSRAVAFERLLENGENFWNRLAGGLADGLRHIATDGESYGHHFMFGEMALAYVIDQARAGRSGMELTNYAAYLAANPAKDEALIHENSSWSCVHGLERWKTHCGCSDGGHPDWIQDWRRPLRRSLNYLKYYVDEHFLKQGRELFGDPLVVLADYGRVLCGGVALERFLDEHLLPGQNGGSRIRAAKLLLMQRQALASFASCAWFFDDVARIEPLNALAAARRAMDLLLETGGPEIEAGFVRVLQEAHSNVDDDWDGEYLWRELVGPRRIGLESLGAFLDGEDAVYNWPGLHVRRVTGGRMSGFWAMTLEQEECAWTAAASVASPQLRAELSRLVCTEDASVLLEKCITAARRVVPLLAAFSEGQMAPHGVSALSAPGLAWLVAAEDAELPESLLDWLRSWLKGNEDVRTMLATHVEDRGTSLARELPANLSALVGMIRQARRLDLPVYWWALQNQVMLLPHDAAWKELRELLRLE